MTAQLYVPLPVQENHTRMRSIAMRACLEPVVRAVVERTTLLLVEVDCPLVMEGPVSSFGADRARLPRQTAASVLMRQLPIPSSRHTPAGTLTIAAHHETALTEAQALPLLVARIIEGVAGRLLAESVAREALKSANRDPSTGLGNRRAWEQTLRVERARAERSGRPLTLLVLDVDGLKAVNDQHGHAAGDRLIARTATALLRVRRATDQVCRLGGDEFGIAAPDTDNAQAESFAARVRSCLEDEGVQVSLGWAVSETDADAHDLWQQADAAMYQDKRSRRP
jgi:diguanylate cyclase (GGDEF)-like protein